MKKEFFSSVRVTLVLAVTVVLTGVMSAEKLPTIDKEPWLGYFSAYERRGFEFGMKCEGRGELYLIDKKAKERIGQNFTIRIKIEVLVEDDEGKVTVKRFKEDGFSTEDEPGLDHKEYKFTATSTGDAKAEVTMKYDRNRIIMDGRIIDRGDLTDGKIYLGIKVSVPYMYGDSVRSADFKSQKKRLRRDKIYFIRAKDKQRVQLKSYENVDLAEDKYAKDGVTEIFVSMDGQRGRDFIFTTEDGRGVIALENKSLGDSEPMWYGYLVKWKREFVENPAPTNNRSKVDKGISPFVFEIK